MNNIIESIHKSPDLYKILPDLNQQLKLLKSRNSVEVQSARSMVKLVSELNSYGIQLGVHERNKIGIQLMEAIIDKYGDRIQVINFDNIYQEIRAINSDYVLDSDEKLMMTNDLLKFKSKLAGKAYQMGKKNLGN